MRLRGSGWEPGLGWLHLRDVTRLLLGVGAALVLVAGCTATAAPSTSSTHRSSTPAGPAPQQALTHDGICLQPPAAFVTLPGQAERPMRTGYSAAAPAVTLAAVIPVGDVIQVRFAGPCTGGTRLAESHSEGGLGATWHVVSTGNQMQTWAPTSPGRWTLALEWGCSGPVRCPLDELGRVTVTAEPTEGPQAPVERTEVPFCSPQTRHSVRSCAARSGHEDRRGLEQRPVAIGLIYGCRCARFEWVGLPVSAAWSPAGPGFCSVWARRLVPLLQRLGSLVRAVHGTLIWDGMAGGSVLGV